MKYLLLDIETSPNLVHVWGLREQDIHINQIMESSYVLCWAAKWLDDDKIYYERTQAENRSSKKMLKKVRTLLDEADCVIHYNGTRFDIPVLNKEFLLHNIDPPPQFKHIDLMKVVQKQFRFTSNKLDYVCQRLNLGKKVEHEGHDLWVKCMVGDKVAWEKMKRYNINDVKITEKLYYRVLPWMKKPRVL